MSAISSTGTSSLYTFVQSLTQSSQTSATTAASSTSSTDPTASTNSAATTSSASQGVQGHHHHGHGGAGKSAFFQQLQQTVTSALQSAQQNGANPNQAIEDAIQKVFQNNNAATSATAATATATSDADAAQANTPASTTTGSAADAASGNSSSLQAFFQTLQSFGVDPQQFHQDFLSAAQGAQNGTVNSGTAFQSIPPGSLLDTTG